MTREEAYRLAMRACEETWNEKTCNQIKEALEQEPCDDAISRQAVLELIDQQYPMLTGFKVPINELPPVTPTIMEGEIDSANLDKQ